MFEPEPNAILILFSDDLKKANISFSENQLWEILKLYTDKSFIFTKESATHKLTITVEMDRKECLS